MEKIILVLILVWFAILPGKASVFGVRSPEQIIIHSKGHTGINHSETDIPLDQPDVYFNSSTMTISIVDYAGCTYDVLVLDSSYNIVHGSLVCGSGSFVLPSSLTSGTYFIEIATSWGNTYVGQLNI